MKQNLSVLYILASLSILLPNRLKSQVAGTVFIDSVEFRINHDLRYASRQTFLKCFAEDQAIPLYTDSIYKLMIVPAPSHIYQNLFHFYHNDTLLYFNMKHADGDYTHCQDLYHYSYTFESRVPGRPDSLNVQISIHYRFTRFIPEDTAGYSLNYREGVWNDKQGSIAGKMRVSYHHDKKHGPTSLLTPDSLLYETSFTHNYSNDYDQVKITNLRTGRSHRGSPILFDILYSCYSAQENTYPSFSFVRKRRSKQISKGDALSVYYDQKGLLHDSISYRARGTFRALIHDTLILFTEDLRLHNFYKPHTDSLHNYYKIFPERYTKVPLKDITKIYRDRDLVQVSTLTAGIIAFYSAVLVAPLVSIQKGSFNTERFTIVSLSSCGAMAVSIATACVFGQQKFVLKAGRKNHRLWKIRPEEYSY